MPDFKLHSHSQYKRWLLQVLQDDLAIALDIPIRIASLSHNSFWSSGRAISKEFNSRFSSPQKLSDYISDVVQEMEFGIRELESDAFMWNQIFRDSSDSLFWKTRQSNANPLINVFRELQCWRRWEFFFIYLHTAIGASSGTFSFLGGHMHYGIARSPRLGHLLVGPVWRPLKDEILFSGQDFHNMRIIPAIDSVISTVHEFRLRRKFELDRWIEKAGSIIPLSSNELSRRLTNARVLFDSTFPALTSALPAHRCEIATLADWGVFSLTIPDLLNSNISGTPVFQRNSAMCVRVPEPLLTKPSSKQLRWIRTECLPSSGKEAFDLKCELLPSPTGRKVTDYLYLERAWWPEPGSMWPNTVDLLAHRFSNQHLRLQKAKWRHERLAEVNHWLNERFGVSALPFSTDTQDMQFSATYDRLCRTIAELLHADLATIYAYHYDDQHLTTLGLFHSGGESSRWRRFVPRQMTNAGHDPSLRRKSVCYRAIDKQESQFIRFYDIGRKNSSNTEKAEAILLDPAEGLTSSQCAIAVPVLIHGRPCGVLEINGFTPYQFRWDDLTFVQQLATMLSPFIHGWWILRGLHELNRIAVETNESPFLLYKEIATQLSRMFLSNAAAIWVREKSYPEKFVCHGWYNRTDLDHNDSIKEFFVDDTEWQINEVTSSGEIWWQATDNEWLGKRPVNFPAAGIKHLCLIPIRDQRGSSIASLSLYNLEGNEYDYGWKNIFSFISRYVALLLEAISTQRQRERRYRAYFAHELKDKASLMKDNAESLLRFVTRNCKFTRGQQADVDILKFDIRTNGSDLLSRIALLSKGTPDRFDPLTSFSASIRTGKIIQAVNLWEQYKHVSRLSRLGEKKSRNIEYHEVCDSRCKKISVNVHGENLRTILTNLHNNAVKYSVSGTPITVTLETTSRALRFSIRNFGPPSTEEEAMKMCEPGFRSKSAINIDPRGEGTGLSLVQEICSWYGLGTSFGRDENVGESNERRWTYYFVVSFPEKILAKTESS